MPKLNIIVKCLMFYFIFPTFLDFVCVFLALYLADKIDFCGAPCLLMPYARAYFAQGLIQRWI